MWWALAKSDRGGRWAVRPEEITLHHAFSCYFQFPTNAILLSGKQWFTICLDFELHRGHDQLACGSSKTKSDGCPTDSDKLHQHQASTKRFSGMEPQFHRLDYMSILNQPSHRFWECVASDDFPNHPTMLKGPTGPVVAASAVVIFGKWHLLSLGIPPPSWKGAHQTITVGGNNVGDTLNYGVVHRCSAPKNVT